jgi:hypothetical protein
MQRLRIPLIYAVLSLAAACNDAATAPPLGPQASAVRDFTVLPPGRPAYGKTYGEWSEAWWQWAYSIPVPANPLFDSTGSLCGTGQSGRVWFLAGIFNATGIAVRDSCVIPLGRPIFIPILNGECSNVEGNGSTVDNLRACAKGQMDLAANLSAEVDGVPVPDIAQYRVQSPTGFGLTLPENNLLQLFGFKAPAGSCLPQGEACPPYLSFADGYYLMLAPLGPGAHTLHVHGEIPAFGFALDVTYHLGAH